MRKSQPQSRKGGARRERHLSVRGVRRDPPDLKKLSQALIALALAQAETDAQAEHENERQDRPRRSA